MLCSIPGMALKVCKDTLLDEICFWQLMCSQYSGYFILQRPSFVDVTIVKPLQVDTVKAIASNSNCTLFKTLQKI